MFKQILARDQHLTGAWREHAGNHAQGGRFAGAVDAEQAEHAAAIQLQAYVADNLATSEDAADVIHGVVLERI